MNTQAIFHLPNGEDTYALTDTTALIRLRAASGDLDAVSVVSIDKYRHMFHDYQVFETARMNRVAADGRYDYYEAVIPHTVQLIDYYFRLEAGGQRLCYGNYQFFDEASRSMDKYFSMPNLKAEDRFRPPDWTREAVIYQIFPDSFYRGHGTDFEGWYRDKRDGDDHLGGTLQGVIDRLDYIETLGANVIYLTPIFASPTNHKYHITDFYEIDPRFGTKASLAELVRQAHARGMKVLLDGVFHSTGLGFFAFQEAIRRGPASPYWSWFHIQGFPVQTEYPINYRAWGQLREMPNLNLDHPAVSAYVQDVLRYWVQEFDIDGWRLDTVDAMSNTFLRTARRQLQAIKPDCILVGELWYDARPWLKGDMLDSVMNYLFTTNMGAFFGQRTARPTDFSRGLGWIRGQYHFRAWEGLWNLLSSHDIVRFFSVAGEDTALVKLAVTFQFTYPGIPFIYAGDELGMTGHSLICRYGLVWDEARQNQDLLAHYRAISRIRQQHPALRHGSLTETLVSDEHGLYGFSRHLEDEVVLVLFNVSDAEQCVAIPEDAVDLWDGRPIPGGRLPLSPKSAALLRHTRHA